MVGPPHASPASRRPSPSRGAGPRCATSPARRGSPSAPSRGSSTATAGCDRALAARVHDATRVLGYRHNAAASALRRADGITASIGLILEDVANPFFSALHRGIEDVARERGYLTFTGSADEDPERERELTAAFTARNVDGLIIAPSPDDHGYLAAEQAPRRAVRLRRPPAALPRRGHRW